MCAGNRQEFCVFNYFSFFLSFLRVVVSLVYFGFLLYISNLAGSPYLNLFLMYLTDIPVQVFLSWFLMKKYVFSSVRLQSCKKYCALNFWPWQIDSTHLISRRVRNLLKGPPSLFLLFVHFRSHSSTLSKLVSLCGHSLMQLYVTCSSVFVKQLPLHQRKNILRWSSKWGPRGRKSTNSGWAIRL